MVQISGVTKKVLVTLVSYDDIAVIIIIIERTM